MIEHPKLVWNLVHTGGRISKMASPLMLISLKKGRIDDLLRMYSLQMRRIKESKSV
jgi:hypothetical protein